MRVQQLFELISADLMQVEAGLLKMVSAQEKILTNMGVHLLAAGGKRLRPALFLLAARTREYDLAKTLPVAISLELIHMATLVHDDVLDEAQIRRGYPTANIKWGNMAAVLAGDFFFAQAFVSIAYIADTNIIGSLAKVVSNMCEGEIMQIANTGDVCQTESDYLLRIQKKTADFIAASCELGAYMSNADEHVINSLKDFGYCIGMAFQITDDMLDVMSSAAQIGKPVGNDLKKGIMTLPIIYALQNSADRHELCGIIGKEDLAFADVDRALGIIRATNVAEYAHGLVKGYIQRAKERLVVIQDAELRSGFARIADFIEQRNY